MSLSDTQRRISSSIELISMFDGRSSSSSFSVSQVISRIVLSSVSVGMEASCFYYPGTSSSSNNQNTSSNQTRDSVETLCAICLQTMDEEMGGLYTVTGCSHVYHKQCISRWTKNSRKCPCCRGPLADDLGLTLSGLHSVVNNEVMQEMTRAGFLENVIFSPIGVAWPICLVFLFLVFETACFGFFIPLVLLMSLYVIFQEESQNIASCICLVIVLCLMFPPVTVMLLSCFILQVFYILYRTVAFYVNVFSCKMRWRSANIFIINRTVALLTYAVDLLNEM